MRIDKYLWCIRLFKTRGLASDQVRCERIILNDVVAKASKEIKPGDHIVLKRHGYNQEFTVLAIPKARLGAKLVPDYAKEIDVTSWAQFALKWLLGNPAITAVIPGTDKPQYMVDNLKAGLGRLPDAAMRKKMVETIEGF